MKVVYIGDGRCRVNWGARATSTALYDLVVAKHTVQSIIESDAKDGKYTRILSLPPFPLSVLKAIDKSNKGVFNFLKKVARKLKLKNVGLIDYVVDDIDQSVKNFMAIKDKYPNLEEMYVKIKEADAVVLNGEGSFIFKTPPRRDALFFLFILKLAKQLGKKAYYLNSLISDCPKTGRNIQTATQMVNILRQCDGISVRTGARPGF